MSGAGERGFGTDRRRPIRGTVRVTDATAVAGSAVWLALVALSTLGHTTVNLVESFVAFALLVLLPLGLGLVPNDRRQSLHPLLFDVAVLGQLPAALLAVAGLALPVGSIESVLLVLPWLGVTGAIALCGLAHLYRTGLRPIPELAIDAALLYVPVGAVALLLHRADVSFHFAPIIILLTAIHYHYAGFVLPLVAGLAGRRLVDGQEGFGAGFTGRVTAVTTLIVVVNLAVIAIGITFSPTIEVLAVALFTVAVAAFAIVVLGRLSLTVGAVPGVLLAVAALSVVGTMALALAYGYSAFSPTTHLIGISRMIEWHGSLNAFGFALPSLLAFRLLDT